MFEFELPDVGEGVAEGEIVAWLVAVGDTVAEDEVLAEVETDKAVVDLPSPKAGTIVELHAEEGDVVPVGDIVVTIDTGEGEASAEEADEETSKSGEKGDEATSESDRKRKDGASGRVFAPPNVRRLARELDVDIATVDGSGPGGRVTEADVRATASDEDETESGAEGETESEDSGPKSAISKVSEDDDDETGELKSAVSKVSADEGTKSADRERTLAAPSTRRIAEEVGVDIDAVPTEKTRDGQAFVEPEDVRAYAESQRAAQAADAAGTEEETAKIAATDTEGEATDVTAGEAETREPYRGIRRTIGEQMEESVYSAPHVSHHDTAVVDDLVEMRADLKPRASEQGVSLTYLPFVMKAVVAGLEEFPILNSTLDEESGEIVLKHYYNIGVAVATDSGLLVPVVENVDQKGLLEIAREIEDVATRARDRSLDREEMQGGTFSITNFGAIGGEYATPIINYPETAILGLGSIEQRPVVVDGEVAARHTLPLSLSIDHRVIDGAEAARFANTVIEYLENPNLLLL